MAASSHSNAAQVMAKWKRFSSSIGLAFLTGVACVPAAAQSRVRQPDTSLALRRRNDLHSGPAEDRAAFWNFAEDMREP